MFNNMQPSSNNSKGHHDEYHRYYPRESKIILLKELALCGITYQAAV